MGSYTFPRAIDGHPFEARGQEPLAFTNCVQPNFFATYGMHLREGRNFTEADRRDSRPVAIINQDMVEVFCPGQSPLAMRIRNAASPHPDWAEIAGSRARDIAAHGKIKESCHPDRQLDLEHVSSQPKAILHSRFST